MAYGLGVLTDRTCPAEEACGLLRSVVTTASRPANLLAVLVVLLGWAALLSWTGNGPGGWQARTCARLDLASRACSEIGPVKDASPVVLHTAEFASWAR